MSDDKKDEKNPTLGSVGSTLGGWAKRLTKVISDVAGPQQSEELQRALADTRELRSAGHFSAAHERLRDQLKTRPNDASLLLSLALTLVEQALVDPTRADVLHAYVEGLGKRSDRSPGGLLAEAAQHLLRSEFDPSLDAIRRARKNIEELNNPLQPEARFVLHLLTTLVQARRGRNERALLELHKARARLPEETRGPLRLLLSRGRADHPRQPRASTRRSPGSAPRPTRTPTASPTPPTRPPAPTSPSPSPPRAIASASRRPSPASTSTTRSGPTSESASAWPLGQVRRATPRRSATSPCATSSSAPDDPRRRRLWALAEAATWTPQPAPRAPATTSSSALLDAARAAPPDLQERHLQELAHLALRAELFPDLRRRRDPQAPARQPRPPPRSSASSTPVVACKIATSEAVEDFVLGHPPRFRSQPDLGGPPAPTRPPLCATPASASASSTASAPSPSAELCLQRGLPEAAQEYLVDVLTESPDHAHASALLRALVAPVHSNRLEDLLTAATTTLAATPARILGVPLGGVQEALSGVIAARERLARPLTIAIMGEFSSGKSTFVNALLGEAVAPMGVLPTTSTINLFRRGPSGSARVHYRDGTISTVARDEVHTFLLHLDDLEASRIRHMEIERTGPHLGDAAVVDTPGLNALDSFHERVAREFVDEADAIIWIFSATRGGAASEGSALKGLAPTAARSSASSTRSTPSTPTSASSSSPTSANNSASSSSTSSPCPPAPPSRRASAATPPPPTSPPSRIRPRAPLLPAAPASSSAPSPPVASATACPRPRGRHHRDRRLEAKADEAATREASDPAQLEHRLVHFADTLYGQILGLDDVLTRECLALGILRAGAAPARAFLAPQDATYLAAVLRDSILRSFQAALADLSQTPGTEALADVLSTTKFVPWAQGFLDSLDASGFVAALVQEHGPAVAKGEAALRERFRVAFQPVAASWRKFVRGLFRHIRQAHRRARHTAASAPRAEALRLRTTSLAGLDALLASLEGVAP
jgi:GTPase SAR1 family protein